MRFPIACAFIALLIAFSVLSQSPPISAQSARSSKAERELRMLQLRCDKVKKPQDALTLIAEFRKANRPTRSDEEQLKDLEKEWQGRIDKGLIRWGNSWVTKEEAEESKRESDQLLSEGRALYKAGDLEGAAKFWQAAGQANKSQTFSHYLLGLVRLEAKDPGNAAKAFKKVVSISPRDVGALNNLAVCELKCGRGPSALNYWETAAEIAPKNEAVIHNLERVIYEQQKGRLRIAKPVFDKYRKLYASLTHASDKEPIEYVTWLIVPPVVPDGQAPPLDAEEQKEANLLSLGFSGSGFCIAPGYFITNRHVVDDETFGTADSIQLSIPEGEFKSAVCTAELVAVSDTHDFALLKCESLKLPALSISPVAPSLGADVLALGYPETAKLGMGVKSTKGSISGISNDGSGLLLYDVTLNHGNSGGPLLDQLGRVVAVNTLGFNVSQELSGGESCAELLKFVQTHIPALAPMGDGQKKEWTEVVKAAQQSTVLVETLHLDAAPIVAANAEKANQLKGAFYTDSTCLICRGSGKTACKNPECHGGVITEETSESFVVGEGNNRRTLSRARFLTKDCPFCQKNSVVCPDCEGTGRANP